MSDSAQESSQLENATEIIGQRDADETKLVWIASMPRSGSMWTYNVTRSVLRHGGRNVFPEEVPKSSKDVMALAAQGLRDTDPMNVWALKVHQAIRHDVPGSRFITTHRDPRDALVSFRRFMQCDFDHALAGMMKSTAVSDYYRSLPEYLCLHLHYPDILQDPRAVVRRIAHHIGVPVSARAAQEIANEFSKDNVRQRIEDAEQDVQQRAASGDTIRQHEIVTVGPQNHRVMDLPTGFQSGHVSDYRDGGWRDCLTVVEKEKIQSALGPWLADNGYPDTFVSV